MWAWTFIEAHIDVVGLLVDVPYVSVPSFFIHSVLANIPPCTRRAGGVDSGDVGQLAQYTIYFYLAILVDILVDNELTELILRHRLEKEVIKVNKDLKSDEVLNYIDYIIGLDYGEDAVDFSSYEH